MLRLVSIGGVGEIGMNMLLVSTANDSILIDCGVLFPSAQHFGIETIVPDYKEFCECFSNVRAIFVTHGHEDHIGGIPYLLKHSNLKIYAPTYAAELIKWKCRSILGNDFKPNIEVVNYLTKIDQGSLFVEYIPVDHSIPDSNALFIRTLESSILYIGDFRLHGRNKSKFLSRIKEIREEGNIDILLSDSTNAHDMGESIGEKDVFSGLDSFFTKARGKIIITLFSSNIARINQVISLCKKHGKNLFVSGINLKTHLAIARSLGYLESDDGCIKPEEEFKLFNEEDVVLICTGSQAERYSSMVKLSLGIHPYAKIGKRDTVIFSSSRIPGNEKAIIGTMNRLVEKGAEVIYDESDGVHCSGHAKAKELKELIAKVKPSYFIPVHGEYIHLKHHINLAIDQGIPRSNCFVLRNGDELIYNGADVRINKLYSFNRYYIDSSTGEFIDDGILKERQLLAEAGLVLVSLVVDEAGKIINKPRLLSYGTSKSEKIEKVLEEIGSKVYNFCKKKQNLRDESTCIYEIKNLVKREFRKKYEGKPMVLVNILEVS